MVNIVTNGHMLLTAHIVIELASTLHDKAKKLLGAAGIKVLGHVCEGHQLVNYSDT